MGIDLKYRMVKVPESAESIAAIIRDDINGSHIVVSSRGIAIELKVAELVEYVNTLESAKLPTFSNAEPLPGIDFDKGPIV